MARRLAEHGGGCLDIAQQASVEEESVGKRYSGLARLSVRTGRRLGAVSVVVAQTIRPAQIGFQEAFEIGVLGSWIGEVLDDRGFVRSVSRDSVRRFCRATASRFAATERLRRRRVRRFRSRPRSPRRALIVEYFAPCVRGRP